MSVASQQRRQSRISSAQTPQKNSWESFFELGGGKVDLPATAATTATDAAQRLEILSS